MTSVNESYLSQRDEESDSDEYYSPQSTPEGHRCDNSGNAAQELYLKILKEERDELASDNLDKNNLLISQEQQIIQLTKEKAEFQKEKLKFKEKDSLLRKMKSTLETMADSKNMLSKDLEDCRLNLKIQQSDSKNFKDEATKLAAQVEMLQGKVNSLLKDKVTPKRLTEDVSVTSSNDLNTNYLGDSKATLYVWQSSIQIAEKKFHAERENLYAQIDQRKMELDKRESQIIEKDRVASEFKRHDYHLNQLLHSKAQEITKLSENNHEKAKEAHFLKLELEDKNKEIRNYHDIIHKLKAVHDVYVDGERERHTLREKIKNMTKQISQQPGEAKNGHREELELLRNKLESLELQMLRIPHRSDQGASKENSSAEICRSNKNKNTVPEMFANTDKCFSRLLHKVTQTDCTLDVFWQISEREESIKDQLVYLYNKKTGIEAREYAVKIKEKELCRLDDFLKTEKSKLALNDLKDVCIDDNLLIKETQEKVVSSASNFLLPFPKSEAGNPKNQLELTVSARVDRASSYKTHHNQYKFRSESARTSPRPDYQYQFTTFYEQNNFIASCPNDGVGSSNRYAYHHPSKSLQSSPTNSYLGTDFTSQEAKEQENTKKYYLHGKQKSSSARYDISEKYNGKK